jgi:urease accessory protein UreF
MADVKVTKKDNYVDLISIVENSDASEERKSELVDFLNKQIEQVEQKAAKAKERREATKDAGDDLLKAVKAVITDEWQSVDNIVASIDVEDATKAKIVARLTKLVKAEEIVKDQTKIGDKKAVVYKLA